MELNGDWLTGDEYLITAGEKPHKRGISHWVRRFLALREVLYTKEAELMLLKAES